MHCTLRRQVHLLALLAHRRLLAIGVTDDDDLAVRVTLQARRRVVENGLSSVIYTPRTFLVGEVDRAEFATARRWRRNFHVYRASTRARQVARISSSHGDRHGSSLQAGRIKGGR